MSSPRHRTANRKRTIRRRTALRTALRSTVPLLAAPLLARTSPAQAAPAVAASRAAEPVRQVLPNGLVLLVEERPTTETLAVYLAARAGSRDDASLPGVSLLTSRLMYQGTPRRPSQTDVERAAALTGGAVSRGTGNELSTYACAVPASEAPFAFDLLGDLVANPLLDPAALDRLKQILLQEIAQRQADPASALSDLYQAEFFAGHPIATPIQGTPQSVPAVTVDDVAGMREQNWGAANLALSIVGKITPADALELAQRSFGALPAGTRLERQAAAAQPITAPRTTSVIVGQQQTLFRLGTAAPPLTSADRYPMTVLNAIVGGASGRLFAALRTERGLAYTAGSSYLEFTDTGSWYAGAGVDPQNLEAALAATRDEIAKVRDTAPDAAEVASKISQIAGSQVLAEESNSARASRMASQELLGTEPVEEFVRRIRAVTPDEVLRIARMYLDLDHALLALAGPPPAPAAAG